MKDFHFYAEMREARGSKAASKEWDAFTRKHLQALAALGFKNNCIAVPLENGRPLWQGNTMMMDAIVTANELTNRWPVGGSVEQDYLRKRCVRVSEELARQLHPNLFRYLERPDGA